MRSMKPKRAGLGHADDQLDEAQFAAWVKHDQGFRKNRLPPSAFETPASLFQLCQEGIPIVDRCKEGLG